MLLPGDFELQFTQSIAALSGSMRDQLELVGEVSHMQLPARSARPWQVCILNTRDALKATASPMQLEHLTCGFHFLLIRLTACSHALQSSVQAAEHVADQLKGVTRQHLR